MAERVLNNVKLIMRNDTQENWNNNNPLLAKGEWGIAIDSDQGVCTIKVGDGVHHWRDLSLKLGEKEQAFNSATNNMNNALTRIRETAEKMGVSMGEMVNILEASYRQGKAPLLNTQQRTNEFQIERFEIPNYKF